MIRKIIVFCAGFLFLTTISTLEAHSITLEELKKYDTNTNGRIDPGREQEIYLIHLHNNILRRFDNSPMNGRLDATEVSAIENANVLTLGKAYSETEVDDIRADLNLGQNRSLEDLAVLPEKKKSQNQKFFLRNNRLDIAVYNSSIDRQAAKGASINYTHDAHNNNDEFRLDGIASWVIGRNTAVPRPKGVKKGDPYLSGYAVATWADFDYRSNRKNSKREIDKLIFGLDGQLEIFHESIFTTHYVTFSPSIHTDFDFEGRIYSGEVIWQPFNTKLNLGGYKGYPNLGFGYTLQAKANGHYQFVDNAGKTTYIDGDNHLWLGGEVGATIWIAPETLKRRLFFKASLPIHFDTIENHTAIKINTSLNYNIDEAGFTALSADYENGEDYQTGQYEHTFKVGLKAKF